MDVYSDITDLPPEVAAASDILRALAPPRKGRTGKPPSFMALKISLATEGDGILEAVAAFAPYSINAELRRGSQEVATFHDTSNGVDLSLALADRVHAAGLLLPPLTLEAEAAH